MKIACLTEFTKSVLIFLKSDVKHHQRHKKTRRDLSLF